MIKDIDEQYRRDLLELVKEDLELIKYFSKKWTECEAWFIPSTESCGIENCPYHNKKEINETHN